MVRNNKGGRNTKKMGRKFAGGKGGNSGHSRQVRFSDCAEEMYACVTRYFGSGMCDVKCIDGETRLCIIRKKFKGRSKRDNMITLGSYVLIGVRDWEVVEVGKKRKCDLLEVYSSSDMEQIKKYLSEEEWEVIRVRGEDARPRDDDDDGISFVDGEMAEYMQEQEEMIMENKKIVGKVSGVHFGPKKGEPRSEFSSSLSSKAKEKEEDASSSSDEDIDIDDI